MMGFDPDKYLAQESGGGGGFDPDAYLVNETKDTMARNKDIVSARPQKDVAESLAVGARSGALMGYAPQVEAAMEPITAKLFDLLNNSDMRKDLKPYVERRDDAAKKQKQYQDDNPKAFMTGNILGGVASSAVPAGAISRAVGGLSKLKALPAPLARVAQAGAAGAGIGAIQNPGDTEGDVSPVQLLDRARNAAIGGATGAVTQGALEGVSKAIKTGKVFTKETAQVIKENLPVLRDDAAEIIAAAKRQGIKVTPGMILKGDKFQNLEASLAKSPSLFNRLGKNIEHSNTTVKEKMGDVLDEASNLSAYEVGDKVRSGVRHSFESRMAPVSEAFDDVAKSTRNIDVSKKGVDRVIKNSQNLSEARLYKGTGAGPEKKIKQYTKILENARTVDDLKKIRTMIGADMRDMKTPDIEKQVLGRLFEKVDRLEKRNIERAAIIAGRSKKEGDQVGKGLIEDLRGAREGYRGIQQDARELSKQTGMKAKNLSEMNAAMDGQTPEEISKRFLNTGDQNLLKYMGEKFPNEFDELRRLKIAEIYKRSISNASGEILPASFIKNVNGMSKEVRTIILGSPQKIETADDVALLYQSLNSVRAFNPSGTGQAMAIKDMATSTVKDIPKYMLYKGMASGGVRKGLNNLVDKASKIKDVTPLNTTKALIASGAVVADQTKFQAQPEMSPALLEFIAKNPELIDGVTDERFKSNLSEKMNRAPQSAPKAKGEPVWATKGFRNLSAEPGAEILNDEAVITELFNSREGADILNQASDLKPGSKAMNALMLKIKNKYSKGKK